MYKTAFLDASYMFDVVLPHEISLIHLHGFLTALPQPRLCLILSCLASASSMLPRPRSRENCLTHITGTNKCGKLMILIKWQRFENLFQA